MITSSENSKKEMVIVYSQTINQFKQLDACLLLCIHEMIGGIAKYKNFRPLISKGAYHQVEIEPKDKPYMVFFFSCTNFDEIPFGVTNGMASF